MYTYNYINNPSGIDKIAYFTQLFTQWKLHHDILKEKAIYICNIDKVVLDYY